MGGIKVGIPFNSQITHLMKKLQNFTGFTALFGRLSIRRRLIAFFCVLSLVPITIIGLISYYSSKNAIAAKTAKYSVDSQVQTMVNLDLKLKKYEDLSTQLQINSQTNQAVVEYIGTGSIEAAGLVKEVITTTLALDEDIRSIFIGSLQDGTCIGAGFDDPSGIYPHFKRTKFFRDALRAKNQVLWGTYESDMVMTRVINNFSTGEPIAVYGVIFRGYKINKLVNPGLYNDANAVSLKNRPYTIIIKQDGMILSSPNTDDVGVQITRILHHPKIRQILSRNGEENGNFFDRILLQGVLVTYSRIVNKNWYLVGISPDSYLYAEIRAVGIATFLIAVIIGMIAVVVSLLVSFSISKPLNQVKDAMQKAAGGDLTAKVAINTHDELADLGKSFNQMTAQIGELIHDTKAAVVTVSNHSQALEASSNQSAQSAEAVNAATTEITKGTIEQTTEAETTVRQMGELAQEIENVVFKSEEMGKITGSTMELSIQSREIVAKLSQKASETDKITDTITQKIQELSESAEEIRNITDVINGIAEQTNLLALNAAIEAARAGEMGQGFAVVAEEVNKLASQSREAVSTINNILKGIQTKTSISAQTAAQAHQIVEEQLETVHMTQKAFDEITAAMHYVVNRISDINAHIRRINEVKNQTMEAITNISAITEQSAASSEEVAASIEEQMAIAAQVKQMADQLHAMADKLVAAVSMFQI